MTRATPAQPRARRRPLGVVAVAGAGGFVGSRLTGALVDAGATEVRRLARRPDYTATSRVTAYQFDLESPGTVARSLEGADTAYYLVHAMAAGGDFAERDRAYAGRFAAAAVAAGVTRVVYLGGLYPRDEPLSRHLESRREVGTILIDECGALVVRAGIIIGPGSASWVILRDLVRRLPAMITPTWVRRRSQPTGIDDVVRALAAAPALPAAREVDIGGEEVLSYEEMMHRVAAVMGRLPIPIMPAPVLSPELSSWWLWFITSVPLTLARSLVESLRHDVLVDGDDLYAELGIRPRGFDAVVRSTLLAESRRRA